LIISDYQFGEKDVLDLYMLLSLQITTEDGHLAEWQQRQPARGGSRFWKQES
jgi:hypothetical protein